MEDILNNKDTENDIKYDELFPSVKTYLRISHDKLDNEINEILTTGRKELVRAGISEDKAFSNDSLVANALRVWCQMHFTNDMNKYEIFFKSWQYQVDNLRKSQDYRKDDTNL